MKSIEPLVVEHCFPSTMIVDSSSLIISLLIIICFFSNSLINKCFHCSSFFFSLEFVFFCSYRKRKRFLFVKFDMCWNENNHSFCYSSIDSQQIRHVYIFKIKLIFFIRTKKKKKETFDQMKIIFILFFSMIFVDLFVKRSILLLIYFN